MRNISWLLIALLFSSTQVLAGEKPIAKKTAAKASTVRTQTVRSGELEFEVTVDPEHNKVDVVPVSEEAKNDPPPMQFQLYSKDKSKSSMPIELQAIEAPDQGPRYAGKLDQWNNSYIGFALTLHFGDSAKKKQIQKEFDRP